MKTLDLDDVFEGLRVKLVYPDEKYYINKDNPVVDSEWECEGEVVGVSSTTIDVEWDNGGYNVYKGGELVATEDIDTGRCQNIW